MGSSYLLRKFLTLVQLLAALLILDSCTRSMDFSAGNVASSATPGVQCTPDPVNLVVPADVEVNHPFNVSVNLTNATWSFLNGSASVGAQGSPASVTLSPIGTYSGKVVGTNNCGAPIQQTFSVDVVNQPITNLSLVINNGATYTNNVNVNLTIAATGATQMYITNDSTCQSGGTWQPYATSASWVLGQTDQLAHVYAQFKNNDYIDSHCISAQITEDDTAPVVQFVSTPTTPTNSKLAQFQVSATDNLSGVADIFCKLDQGSYAICATQFQFANLVDGSHTVSVYATDNAGNQSQPISYTWIVDTVAPVVKITQEPSNPSVSHDAQFAFTVTDTIAIKSTQCSIDGNALSNCTSPISYNLPNGTHTFLVTATDIANNSGSASYTWVINDKINIQTITVTSANGKADILFVVDNNPNMYDTLSGDLPDRFQNFISDLGTTDYRIAYITADASGVFRSISHGSLLPILFQSTPGDRGQAEVPTENFINSSSPDISQSLIATMVRPEVICQNVGSASCIMEGSGYQEGIHSTLEALQNLGNINKFMRNDAALNVIIISQQDEGDGNLTTSSGQIKSSTPSYNLPQTLVSYMKTNYPDKQFRVHGVYPRPQDYCNGTLNRAYIYDDLVKMTGGTSSSICNGTASDVLNIAQSVQSSSVVTYQLKCVPQAGTLTATYNPQPATPIQLVVNGSTLSFNPSPAPGTVVQLQYVCP